MRTFMALMLATVLVPAIAARAASFNCARATTPHEHHICDDPSLDVADTRMGDAYRVAAASFPVRGAVLAVQRRFPVSYVLCDSPYEASCTAALSEQTDKLVSMVNAAVYTDTPPGASFSPDNGIYWMIAGAGETVVHYFGGYMPDMNSPEPFPQGFVCDDSAVLSRSPGGYSIHQDLIDITVTSDLLTASVSCGPRNGLSGTFRRVR